MGVSGLAGLSRCQERPEHGGDSGGNGMRWHCDSGPGREGGGMGDEGAASRKREQAYAGGGGTGPLVALLSTPFELGTGDKAELCRL